VEARWRAACLTGGSSACSVSLMGCGLDQAVGASGHREEGSQACIGSHPLSLAGRLAHPPDAVWWSSRVAVALVRGSWFGFVFLRPPVWWSLSVCSVGVRVSAFRGERADCQVSETSASISHSLCRVPVWKFLREFPHRVLGVRKFSRCSCLPAGLVSVVLLL
jgi:hypothetical protein